MASEQLAAIVAGMRSGGPDFMAAPKQARAEFETLLETIPVDPEFAFHWVDLAGVSTLQADTGKPESATLYFHGGGYVAGSASGYRGIAANLGKAAGTTTYIPEYALAPEAPFPAAIEDAISAYQGLLDRGQSPGSIVLAGDSAGGGIVVAMLLKLRDAGKPLPAGAVLFSPLADLTCSAESYRTKQVEDPSLNGPALRALADHYLSGADPTDPLASPIFGDLGGLPPMLIQVGSAEILLDDSVALARAAGAAGTRIELEIWPDMIHVWQSFSFMLPEGQEAIKIAGEFVRKCVAGE